MNDRADVSTDRDLQLVRGALAGQAGARAVLADRLALVSLELARRAGAGLEAPSDTAFVVEAEAVLSTIVEGLASYRGEAPLDDWLRGRVARACVERGSAQDPESLAERVDAAAVLERQLGSAPRERRVDLRKLRRRLPVIGVALLIALFLWEDPDLGSGPSVEQTSGGQVRLLGPVGPSDSWGVFHWAAEAEPGYGARVVIVGDDGRSLRSPRLEEPSWTPSPEQRAALPDRVRWEVIEDGGRRGWAKAWLRAR
jgi:hypothetical protein